MIRLMHAGMLPTPGDLLRKIESGEIAGGMVETTPSPSNGSGQAPSQPQTTAMASASGPAVSPGGAAGLAVVPQSVPAVSTAKPPEIVAENTPAADPMPTTLAQLAKLFERRADGLLYSSFYTHVHPVRLDHGRFEFRPADGAPSDLANRIGAKLGEWTGQRWMVTVSGEPGQPTLKQRDDEAAGAARRKALDHPTVKAVLDAFPGAKLDAVRMFDDELAEDGMGQSSVDTAPSDDEIAEDP